MTVDDPGKVRRRCNIGGIASGDVAVKASGQNRRHQDGIGESLAARLASGKSKWYRISASSVRRSTRPPAPVRTGALSYRSSARSASSRNWHGLRSRDPAPGTMLISDQPNQHLDRRRMGATWHSPRRASACLLESEALLLRVPTQRDPTWDCVQSWADEPSPQKHRSPESRRDRRRRVPWQLRR